MNNNNTDGELAKFMADPNYDVKIAFGDCEKDHEELIKHLKKQGYEVWPEIRTTDGKKCDVIYRIPKNISKTKNT